MFEKGVQLDTGEEVITTAIYPTFRDDGTRAKALYVPDEHVDYMLNDLLGEARYDHFDVAVEVDRKGMKAI